MREWSMLLIVCLLFSLLPPFESAALAESSGLGAASVTEDVYAVSGDDADKRLKVDYVNFNVNSPPQKSNYVALYTSGAGISNHTNNDFPNTVFVKKYNVAIQVDKDGQITRVIGPSTLPVSNATWEDDQYIDIPDGGFVLIASDPSWNTPPQYRASLFEFRNESAIFLERGGRRVTAADFLQPYLNITTESSVTVTTDTHTVSGTVVRYDSADGLSVQVNGTDVAVQPDGSFSHTVSLVPGENEVSVRLFRNGTLLDERTVLIIYAGGDLIEIEAPPEDINLSASGPRKKIDYIDTDISGINNVIALFTTEYGSSITVPQYNVAIQVDANSVVTKMVNPAGPSGVPNWTGPTELEIPEGGYVVMAQDVSYATYEIKRFLATKFKVGDPVKLRKNGAVVPVTELMRGTGATPRLTLDNLSMYTITAIATTISGKVTNPQNASVEIDGRPVTLNEDGTFRFEVALSEGANYIDVELYKNGTKLDTQTVIVYSRPSLPDEKRIILWVDQAANAKKFQTSESVYNFLKKAKDAGVTDIAFDVKGVEGFVSYKNSDLTNRPYVSELTAPVRAGANPNLDLLAEFIRHGHDLGLKVHAAMNIFAEGSIAYHEFAVIDDHLDWEEHVYRPEDNGEIKRLRESVYGQRGLNGESNGALVLFVNPANDEVREFELLTIEEVLKNYDVDGIMLDRARYDNETADFSEDSRAKFEAFLQQRGKQLNKWPDDVFRYEGTTRVEGPLIQDWWEFRAETVTGFVEQTRELVDEYERTKNREIELSAYVGAWFETYYVHGVNWGSPNFRYDERLGFPKSDIYTENYIAAGYAGYLDFLMVGTYYSTTAEIQKYITIDTIVTNGELPLYAGMALSDLLTPALMREIFQSALGSSHGLMLFDASLANWSVIKAAIRDEEYVKDYQVGVSNPRDPASFIEADYYNVSRNLGDMIVYDEEYGPTTGTSTWGVEVVVDANGVVTRVVNQNQAINWNWASPETNNSPIPAGGMVVSALDESGVRTKRQLLANTYQVGDEVRAAVLTGFRDYDGKTVSTADPVITGNVKVMGAGSSVQVTLNGIAASVDANGDFTGSVHLLEGDNTVTFEVFVDGYKTNSKTIRMTYRPEGTPPEEEPSTPPDSEPGSSDPGTEPSTPAPGPSQPAGPTPSDPQPVENGVIVPVETVESTDENGKTAAAVTVDADALIRAAETLKQQGSETKELIIDVQSDQPVVHVSVPAQALAAAGSTLEGAILTVKAGNVHYRLPVDLIDVDELAGQWGVPPETIQWTVTIEKITGEDAEAIAAIVEAEGGQVIGDAYMFRLTATSGDQQLEVSDFGTRYVIRTITLPQTVSDDATVVVVDPETGEMTFVPALFEHEAGSTTVIIKRTGNSIYTVVQRNKTFADIQGHWAQADIERLASKLLVKGVTDDRFEPERPITRAEFTALLVRMLGLVEKDGFPAFRDIRADDWHAGAIAAAAAAGLVTGYTDGTFRPDAPITREELAVLAQRSIDFVGVKRAAATSQALRNFADAAAISDWAQVAVSIAVSEGIMIGVSDDAFAPQAHTTRAQAVVILKRMAVKLELVNESAYRI
jgi:uncharacterized lipoprotein YddW (UPF0748 family)